MSNDSRRAWIRQDVLTALSAAELLVRTAKNTADRPAAGRKRPDSPADMRRALSDLHRRIQDTTERVRRAE